MRAIIAVLLFLQGTLLGVATDFDVAVVGTSPVCLLEALYHLAKNETVLVLEEDSRCGGAWKAVDMCGVANVDLGCHLIGSDTRVKEFLETYFGCRFVCMEHPKEAAQGSHLQCNNGYYFSGGCHELISRLQKVFESSRGGRLLHRKVESVYLDPGKEYVELSLGDIRYTARKIFVPPMCYFRVEHPSFNNQETKGHYYYHLYMLIEDGAPSHFTYMNGIVLGMSRAMNLTPFMQMPRPGLQLIVIQASNANELKEGQKFLDAFKSRHLLSPHARIIATDQFVYHQSNINCIALQSIAENLVEALDTSSFGGMVRYLDRWKSALVPLLHK